jgi:hypothetical protein
MEYDFVSSYNHGPTNYFCSLKYFQITVLL